MAHTCRDCNRTFGTELELELHRDTCSADRLFCDRCGEKFAERRATTDGWHYECPTEGCDGAGIQSDLHRVRDARVAKR